MFKDYWQQMREKNATPQDGTGENWMEPLGASLSATHSPMMGMIGAGLKAFGKYRRNKAIGEKVNGMANGPGGTDGLEEDV